MIQKDSIDPCEIKQHRIKRIRQIFQPFDTDNKDTYHGIPKSALKQIYNTNRSETTFNQQVKDAFKALDITWLNHYHSKYWSCGTSAIVKSIVLEENLLSLLDNQ
jgi:Ca2+-binding EF-hand superfamily protein